MKKLLLICAAMVAMVTVVSSAHASDCCPGGIDLSANACPGNPGALGDLVPIDCTSGDAVVILGTWAPAENITDLVSLDADLVLYVGAGLDNAGFWDFANLGRECNPDALITSQHRSRTGCRTPVEYTDTWGVVGSGTAVSAFYPHGPRTTSVGLSITCYRPTYLSVTADQMLFGMQLIVDGRYATEYGGTCNGCPQRVSLLWAEANPGAANGVAAATHLAWPTGHFPGFGTCIGLNGSADCSAVPTVRRTWGQLKSLYR